MMNKKTRFVAGLLVCMMLCSMLALMCSAKETAVTYGKIAVDAGANVRSRAVDGTIYFTAPKDSIVAIRSIERKSDGFYWAFGYFYTDKSLTQYISPAHPSGYVRSDLYILI